MPVFNNRAFLLKALLKNKLIVVSPRSIIRATMRSFTSFGVFLSEARKFAGKDSCGCQAWKLLKFFPAWRRSLRPGASPLQDRQPWMTFAAIAFLRRTLNPKMRVFEYGSGGSTLFFSKHAAEILTVEHDPAWGRKVAEALHSQQSTNARVELVEPQPNPDPTQNDPADPAACISKAEQYRGLSFRSYVSRIDAWPDHHFDIVVVDGRARPACLQHAAPKIKPGGWLVLDNAERDYYHPVAATFTEPCWHKRDFSGPGPYLQFFWKTWAWQKIEGISERAV